ncbi:MAG: LamG domain-containing protein [Nitrososphaera sp.]|nr:LamG domain-containing protein [Nitrososphaera sp.]
MGILSPWTTAAKSGGGVVASTTLALAHFNGTDGSTTTTDEVGGVSWTLSNAELDTAQKQFGSASLLITGAGTVASGFSVATTDSLTVEFFGRIETASSDQLEVILKSGAGVNIADLNINGTGPVISWILRTSGSDFNEEESVTINDATWYHVALVFDNAANTISVFFNGNRLDHKTTNVGDLDDTITNLLVATAGGSSVWMDEFRISTVAQYSGLTYTIPDAEFSV